MRRLAWLGLCIFAAGMLVWEALPRMAPKLANAVPPPSRIIATLWHLKMAKDRLNEPSDLTPMNISEIMALPTFLLYPMFAQLREISILEQRGVIVTGFIARVRLMRDGDYKIQITSAPVNGCLRYNSPEQLVTELTPGVQARKPRYTLANLEALCGTDTPVRIWGWLFYDATHLGERYRGTPWEVHPITRIEVCCWREIS